jgi:hypothetical protein
MLHAVCFVHLALRTLVDWRIDSTVWVMIGNKSVATWEIVAVVLQAEEMSLLLRGKQCNKMKFMKQAKGSQQQTRQQQTG